MIVKFNTKDTKVSGNVISTMEAKITQRFRRYFANEEKEATVFSIKIADKKFRYRVEITLPYMGYMLRTEVYDDMSALAALDKAMDILERQISKCKTKLERNKHQVPDIIKDAPAFEEEPEKYDVVRIKTYEMKPMTVQEAILNMNMVGHSFYMFSNVESGKLSTVYQRTDGDYGLIEPL